MTSKDSISSDSDRASAQTCADGERPLRVEYRRLEDLIPYARNARTHSDAQIAQIAASIKEFGWTNPVLADGANGVIAGHGRLLAARKLGMLEVPVIELAGLPDNARRAYVLADNKLALNAGWDEAMLGLEVGELADLGLDLSLTGFSDRELQEMASDRNSGLTDPDEVPELSSAPTTKLGDVWLLGRHRLICGDCTDPIVVATVLGAVQPHLMVTDPPYGVEYDPKWRTRVRRADGSRVGALAVGEVLNDDQADWTRAWDLFPGDVAYVWHAALHSAAVATSLEAAGFAIRAQIIWDKTRLIIGRGDYHWQHEPAWYAVRKGKTGHWSGDRKQTTVWGISHQKSETGHGTQKPVECMKRPIENNSSPGQAIYDPFHGSGTTLIASELSGRTCYAVELAPAYVDCAVLRWQSFTGEKARLSLSNEDFDAVSKQRKADHAGKELEHAGA